MGPSQSRPFLTWVLESLLLFPHAAIVFAILLFFVALALCALLRHCRPRVRARRDGRHFSLPAELLAEMARWLSYKRCCDISAFPLPDRSGSQLGTLCYFACERKHKLEPHQPINGTFFQRQLQQEAVQALQLQQQQGNMVVHPLQQQLLRQQRKQAVAVRRAVQNAVKPLKHRLLRQQRRQQRMQQLQQRQHEAALQQQQRQHAAAIQDLRQELRQQEANVQALQELMQQQQGVQVESYKRWLLNRNVSQRQLFGTNSGIFDEGPLLRRWPPYVAASATSASAASASAASASAASASAASASAASFAARRHSQ